MNLADTDVISRVYSALGHAQALQRALRAEIVRTENLELDLPSRTEILLSMVYVQLQELGLENMLADRISDRVANGGAQP